MKTRSAAIFSLRRFNSTAPTGNVYTLFVKKYAKYLEEQVSVLRLLGFNFERKRDCCKDMSVADAFKRVPKLQSQLNALLNCKVCLTTTSVILPKKMRGHLIGNNQLLVYIFMLLLKDSLVLYPILNDGVIFLIDRVSKMKKKEVQKVLDIYSLFVKETDAIISLYEIAKSFAQNLPVIHKVC